MAFEAIKEMNEGIDLIKEELNFLTDVTGTEIPKTIKEATDRKWELVFNGIEAFANSPAYPGEYQESDARSLITCRQADAILSQYEEKLVSLMCIDTKSLIIRYLTDYFLLAVAIVKGVPELFEEAFSLGQLLGFLIATGYDWGRTWRTFKLAAVFAIIYVVRCARLVVLSYLDAAGRSVLLGNAGLAYDEANRFRDLALSRRLFSGDSPRYARKRMTRR